MYNAPLKKNNDASLQSEAAPVLSALGIVDGVHTLIEIFCATIVKTSRNCAKAHGLGNSCASSCSATSTASESPNPAHDPSALRDFRLARYLCAADRQRDANRVYALY